VKVLRARSCVGEPTQWQDRWRGASQGRLCRCVEARKGIDWWQVRGMEKEQLSLICEAESGKRWEDAPDKNSRSAGDRR